MLPKGLKAPHCLIAGICLFTTMVSAQATLSITFEEDAANGLLNIRFSGETVIPFNVAFSYSSSAANFDDRNLWLMYGSPENLSYFGNSGGWALDTALPWTNGYSPVVAANGVGGLYYGSNGLLQLYSTAYAIPNEILAWDGIVSYNGTLAGIGLTAGTSGTLIFTKAGEDPLYIDWVATAVPEPTTYALLVSTAICGVAFVRRRRSR